MFVPETAEVKNYFNAANKKYGFARVLDESGRRTGEDIHFHINQGHWIGIVENDLGEPDLDYTTRISAKGRYVPRPHSGDRIIFMRLRDAGDGENAESVYRWAYEWHYLKKVDELKRQLDV